jgi:hypothetical protein
VDVPLYVVPMRRSPVGKRVQTDLGKLDDQVVRTFRVPDGDDLVTSADLARVRRQLALGYYLVWTWGDRGPDREWIEARRNWAAVARAGCEDLGIDTEGMFYALCEKMYAAGERDEQTDAWHRWHLCRSDKTRAPVPKPVWVTTGIVEAVVDVAHRQGRCLVWYEDLAVLALLASIGLECTPAGQAPTSALAAVSVRSHGTGLDLQAWSRNVMLTVPSAGAVWEQVLGRTHRPGQSADDVLVWRPAWAPVLNAAWSSALDDAVYIHKVMGQEQKLELIQEVEDVQQW